MIIETLKTVCSILAPILIVIAAIVSMVDHESILKIQKRNKNESSINDKKDI
ncbi:MAG: hypothetical protein IJ593_05795 [Lachnospiraceae bacterium]|nr:hypothetical protein [Lachnospiraceae bacterium]